MSDKVARSDYAASAGDGSRFGFTRPDSYAQAETFSWEDAKSLATGIIYQRSTLSYDVHPRVHKNLGNRHDGEVIEMSGLQ